jgi:hypothetical protein
MEDKLHEMFFTTEHVLLVGYIFAVLVILKWLPKIGKWLFAEKRKVLIAPINLALSALGIYVFGLTTFTTNGMKAAMLFIASAFVILTYEAILKYIINFIADKIKAKLK